MQKKILLLVPDLLVAGGRNWLGSGRFSVLLAELGVRFGLGVQKKVKHLIVHSRVILFGYRLRTSKLVAVDTFLVSVAGLNDWISFLVRST